MNYSVQQNCRLNMIQIQIINKCYTVQYYITKLLNMYKYIYFYTKNSTAQLYKKPNPQKKNYEGF